MVHRTPFERAFGLKVGSLRGGDNVVLPFYAIALLTFDKPFALVQSASGTKSLIEPSAGEEKRLVPSSGQVSASPGLAVRIAPGSDEYPGVRINAPAGSWDLSGYGHVEARVTNTGAKPLYLALRVDGKGDWRDNPWNAEADTIQPGETKTLKTIFGHSYGYKPGYKLDPKSVVGVLLFASKSMEPQSFRIESLVAAGPAGEKPAVAPDDVRIVPKGGVLLDKGAEEETKLDVSPAGSLSVKSPKTTMLAFPTSGEGSASYKPKVGRWDLGRFTEVRVELRNSGTVPVTPRARIETNGGNSDWVSGAVIAPGQAQTITIPFPASRPYDVESKTGGTTITSDAVSGIGVATIAGGVLTVERIAAATTAAPLPDWLGKRPPVPGDWTKTLSEEFNGKALDPTVWKTTGENYYDKVSGWSKENVRLGDGTAKLRFEKRRVHHNDDPTRPEFAYASGFLDTYGLWAQRYGYFEARTKLPTAPGVWPAFWLMPDRGPAVGEQWKRQFTGGGAMEFDIMETLSRWGPHRYNIAMHYDGYEKDHKALGTDKVYVQPDKGGFITCGLLWTPGRAVYYCNGREVLRWENPRISNVQSVIMFTLPSGGWDNSPLDDAQLPADFVIDYVRVWQRKDLASSADGKMRKP
jgi:beta-glucanase (GH16 family)